MAACIEGNDMYSLAGAQFKITASGYSDKTVTTGADGTVVISDTYNVGTVITVKEIKAPPGYILNSQSKQFTITADGNNVFVMKDKPVFDPNALRLTKTGNNAEKIAGAVFKVEYFDNDNHSGTPLRTWYFQSDSYGVVDFNSDHLASGYTSSDLFKPYGDAQGPMFPLGSVKVTEIKAAPNYILPSGTAATAYIYIEQSEDTLSAKARWGDANGNSVTTLGIYKFTNDGVKAVNQKFYGTLPSIKKVGGPSNVSLAGAVFEVVYYDKVPVSTATETRTWYFKTNASGTFEFNASYLDSGYTSNPLFPVDSFPLGLLRIREIKAPEGFKKTDTKGFWRMKQVGNSVTCNWVEGDGETETTSYGDDVYVQDGSTNGQLYFKNTPYGTPPIVRKVDPSGVSLENAIFKVEYFASTSVTGTALNTWYFKTDANGQFKLDAAHRVNTSQYPSDSTLYPITAFPSGMMRIQEVKAPEGFIKSNTIAYWSMRGVNDSYWSDANGNAATGFGSDLYVPSGSSSGELYVKNMPIPGTMTMAKTLPADTPGGLEGYCFNIYRHEGQGLSSQLWKGRSDDNGNIYQSNDYSAKPEGNRNYTFTGLYDGYYSIRELLSLRDFKNTKTTMVTFTVTDKHGNQAMQKTFSDDELNWQSNGDCTISKVHLIGLNGGGRLSITIQNEPIPVGSITIKKVDESGRPMPGVTFLLEYSVDGSAWSPVTSREETSSITPGGCTSAGLSDGKLTTGSDGLAAFTGLCLETDSGPVLYRLTETATKPGYGLMAGPAYEGPLPEGEAHDVTLTAVNMPEFQMPMTGGRGFTGTTVSTLVALTAATALVCLLRKKRKN